MSKLRIPKQLFVVHHTPSGSDFPMGFLHEYSPNTSTGQKKIQTQLEWAFNARYGLEVKFDGINWRRCGREYKFVNGNNFLIDVDEIISPLRAPKVWDNTPLDGFRIVDTTSRYSTSNKFWVVEDPRGVKFEISTPNFEKIVLNGTIVSGVIQEKCIWLGNKNLVLANSI